jgi:2-C-methyl-D-erythritol 4-phosphate cytidylyltransferase/2-C-methyl-D-erythritol 2,4-cyclodiphosphate synthase
VINALIEAAAMHGAAAVGVPVKDTIKIVTENCVSAGPARDNLYSMQTPQGFRKALINSAFEKAYEENFYGTDETSLLERLNEKVYIVKGDYSNIKITTIEDIAVAEAMLKMNPDKDPGGSTMRVGTGYDVHAFAKNRKLILGGVEIPFERGLMGHSDADVLLHAIMDALLGACALADIGKYFPDTDENYRGISSLILLEKVGDLIGSEGYEICNIDATVIAERPKIAPYIHQMIKHIAEVLKIQEDKVNIKATTTEGLGFIGREEGIAAQAIVAVEQ